MPLICFILDYPLTQTGELKSSIRVLEIRGELRKEE